MISEHSAARHDLAWFHGRLSRDQAFRLLIDNGKQDGLFLVRESTNAPGSFVLSVWNDHQAFHYQIRHHGHSRFSIDEGPVFTGLDTLVNYYRDQAGGLATNLSRCCVGRSPPPSVCQTPTSLYVELGRSLNRACELGDEVEVHKILQDPNLNVEAMNDDGSTALHVACKKGNRGIVWLLTMQCNANVNSRDIEGRTPLMYACRGGNVKVCEILVHHRSASIQDRSYGDGYVALHIAAMRGHKDCVELLLRAGAPLHPRSRDGDTPKDLAKDNGHYDLAKYLEDAVVPAPKTKPRHWLHENVDREAAVALLFKWQYTDGLFLIRTSTRAWGVYVLTMAVRNTPYHFQIQSKGDRWFYIDDGPLFETLPHLVEYYGALADGLPYQLTKAIQPNGNPPISLPYHSIPLPQSASLQNFNNQPQTVIPQPQVSRFGDDSRPQQSSKPFINPSPANNDHPDDFNKLEDPTHQLPGRRQPPPLPRNSPSKFNRPPPPLPIEVREVEDKPQTIIQRNELEQGAELGQGEFGSVLRAVWRNPNGAAMDVALKTLHPDKVIQGEQEFLREARVMSGLNHVCIVKLLGVCLGPPLILVQELVSMGALLDYLFTFMLEISLSDLKRWAAQIAWGMTYLEGKRFVHRDLATRNILLQTKSQIKISDFGLSRAIGSDSNYYVASKGGRWPVKWYAPESVNYGRFSHESDVWSYGVTLWEMFSFGQLPYGEMSGAQVMDMVENQGKRLARPDKCPEHTYQLMLRCWDLLPEKRPTFAELHQIFRTNPLYSDVELNG